MIILGEKILAKYTPQHAGLIELPENINLKEVVEGTIWGIGNRIPPESGCDVLKIGDKIRWTAYAGIWDKIEGETVCILRPNDIIGYEPKE